MSRRWPAVAIVACSFLLAFGLVRLFQLRFESGDAYPPYSSLRADPLGTMAFYESLERLQGISTHRDHSTANRLPEGRNTTYLHLAAPRGAWDRLPANIFREVERFVRDGGRLVITLHPEAVPAYWERSSANERDEDKYFPMVSIRSEWGIGFVITNLVSDGKAFQPTEVTNTSGLALPDSLHWYSGIVMLPASDWQTIYVRGTNAVVVERAFGRGSVVIATDTYFLSNEAMLEERHPGLLAWLIGPNPSIFFDEAHLGVADHLGVATLLRKYRLYWLIAGFILLAGLFIWKNASSLVPPSPMDQNPDHIAGRDAAAGFVNLLRRSISVSALLPACIAEWRKSIAVSGKYSQARRRQAEDLFAEQQGLSGANPVATYRSIVDALETRKHPLKP
jgi:hypothetical protein